MDRLTVPAEPTRRSFFRSLSAATAAVAAGTVGVTATGGAAQAQAPGAGGRALPNLYPNWNAKQFRDIKQNENEHLPAVIAMIQALGGTPRPKPTFQNLEAPNIVTFGTLAQALENTGSGGNLGAAPTIFSRQVLAFAGSIGFIEARHAGWLNTLFNDVISQNVFGEDMQLERPLTQQEVVTIATPFIRDLNGGPPPAFSLTPSRRNDLDILNFVLLVEYLENDFYNINVPKFFPAAQ